MTEVNREELAKVLASDREAFVPCGDPEAEQHRQWHQYSGLTHRATSDSIRGFLARYDACMRLCEIITSEYGYLFGSSPHRGFKKLIARCLPEFGEAMVSRLVNERHSAKKSAVAPSPDSVKVLASLQLKLLDLAETLTDKK